MLADFTWYGEEILSKSEILGIQSGSSKLSLSLLSPLSLLSVDTLADFTFTFGVNLDCFWACFCKTPSWKRGSG